VQTPEYRVGSLNDLKNTPATTFTTTGRNPVPGLLSNVANLKRDSIPTNANQANIQPVYEIFANADGRDLGSVANDIDKIVAEYRKQLSPGNRIEVIRQIDSMNAAFRDLAIGIHRHSVCGGVRLSVDGGELSEMGRPVRGDSGAPGNILRHRYNAVYYRHHVERTLAHGRWQWGACWLACQLYEQLELDRFWATHLPNSREGTNWQHILQTLVCYRLIDPGSEWRLHRQWFEQSAMGDLLGDYSLAAKDSLYRCLDKLLPHKVGLFTHLRHRWQDLFGAKFEILLYDLTSTYFDSEPPDDDDDKRRFGYSRDKRHDCVQVVISLVITPDGFPLAYEVLPGNTHDNTTLRSFLAKIEAQYGKAQRVWVVDRGIPTEEVLTEMRLADPPVSYLVGTPKGRLTKLERDLLDLPWQEVRQGVEVKLLAQDAELYVLAKSHDRVIKERAIRRRKLKLLWARLKEIAKMELGRDELLMKLGAARSKVPAAWRLVDVQVVSEGASFSYALNRNKLRKARRREGRYLLRTNLCGKDPAQLWQLYIQLTEIEAAFKNLKDDLKLRPIHHQLINRIESWHSWPTACTSPYARDSNRWRAASPPERS
jgi:hypothetical protein